MLLAKQPYRWPQYRVMNGNPSVDEALAEKVRAAATELNYSASPLARSLVLGKTTPSRW